MSPGFGKVFWTLTWMDQTETEKVSSTQSGVVPVQVTTGFSTSTQTDTKP